MRITVSAFATRQGVEYLEAQGLMNYLAARKIAVKCGTVKKVEGSRGKGSTLWEVPDSITLNMAEEITPAAPEVAPAPAIPEVIAA